MLLLANSTDFLFTWQCLFFFFAVCRSFDDSTWGAFDNDDTDSVWGFNTKVTFGLLWHIFYAKVWFDGYVGHFLKFLASQYKRMDILFLDSSIGKL